ncbi:MAG: type II toxin-antitoxin system RelE/ParE family toxin [Bacteroidota bacterium]
MKRRITFYGDHFTEFYSKQSLKVQKKIENVFNLIRQVERVPEKFFKHLSGTNGLRVEYESNIFRIFCCLDEGKLVVLFNGFQKKSQKTPANELEKAKKLREEYFKSKSNGGK